MTRSASTCSASTRFAATRSAFRAIALGAVLALPSCGYRMGFGNPHGIRSVRILAVDDRSFRRSIAERLTRQLGRDLTRFTGLVPGNRNADAELEITVVEAPGRSVVEGNGGAIVEGAIGLRAIAVLRGRSGRILHERTHIDWAEYRAPVGEQRQLAFDEAIADLSRKILLGVDLDFARNPQDAGPKGSRDARDRSIDGSEGPGIEANQDDSAPKRR